MRVMKKKQLLQFGIGLAAIILLNIAASQLFFRIDLTEDNRYSISPATEQILENLDDQVFVTVYLAGDDLPAGFKRLETAIQERLEEFTVYGGKNIQYTFTDPGAIVDKKARSKFYQQLISKAKEQGFDASRLQRTNHTGVWPLTNGLSVFLLFAVLKSNFKVNCWNI